MTVVFVTRIPKGLKHAPVSRIIKQGIETVAQVKKIWVHPNKGYAFVELYCESSIDMVLTLDKQIEVNKAPLQLERSKSSIRKRRQQVTKKQVEHVQTPDSLNSSSFVGYHTYTEYKHDRNKKERGHKPAVISIRKLKKKKPWKKVTMQTPITPPRPRLVKKVPTGFEHSRKRNYHHIIAKCPSITTCVEHRNRKQNSVLNSIPVDSIQNVEEDIIPACGKDASKISTPHTDCGSSSLKTSGYFTFQKRLPLKRVANNPGSQFVQAHVYHNSKYLFDIDVDNNMVFESIQTAICHKHKITSDSFLLFFNGRLLDKTSQTMICNDENIHMTVKGVGGMNEDDRQSSRRRRRLRGAQERIRGATWNRVEDRYSSSGPFEHQHVTRKPVNSSGRRTYFDRWSAENRSASSNRGYLATRSKPITRQTEKTTKPVEDISPSLREISSSLDHLHLTPTPSSRSRRSTITDVDDWLSRGNRTASDYYSSRHFAISPEPVDQQTDPYYGKELKQQLRIVLIGKTGVGKSATSNTLLGTEAFKSFVAGASVTHRCQSDEARRFGKHLVVVDTPGMYDTDVSIEQTKEEVSRLINMTIPGPHAIILVVAIGRFTKEEQDTIRQLAELFGDDIYKYMIVLFTGRDHLERQSESLETFIKKGTQHLRDVLDICNYQYIAFDNTKPRAERDSDAKQLVDMVDVIVERNGGSHYTNEMYKKAVEVFRTRELERQREKEEQKRLHEEQIRNEVRAEYRKLHQEMEEKNRSLQYDLQQSCERAVSNENEIRNIYRQMKENKRKDKEREDKIEQEKDDLQAKLRDAETKLAKYMDGYEVDPKQVKLLQGDVKTLTATLHKKERERTEQEQDGNEQQQSMQAVLDSLQKKNENHRKLNQRLLDKADERKKYQETEKEKILNKMTKMQEKLEEQLQASKNTSDERNELISDLQKNIEKLLKEKKKKSCSIM